MSDAEVAAVPAVTAADTAPAAATADSDSASASAAAPSAAAVAAPSPSAGSVASAAAALSAGSNSTPVKEERKVGKLNLAAFNATPPAESGPAPGPSKPTPGKLANKMNIPMMGMFAPGGRPPIGQQTMPAPSKPENENSSSSSSSSSGGGGHGADGASTTASLGSSADASAEPSSNSASSSVSASASSASSGPHRGGYQTAPGKLNANLFAGNLNAMLGAGPPKKKLAATSSEEEQPAASSMEPAGGAAGEEEAVAITHAKRAKVQRKARTKPTQLAAAGLTSGFQEVELSDSRDVGPITIVSTAALVSADGSASSSSAAAAGAAGTEEHKESSATAAESGNKSGKNSKNASRSSSFVAPAGAVRMHEPDAEAEAEEERIRAAAVAAEAEAAAAAEAESKAAGARSPEEVAAAAARFQAEKSKSTAALIAAAAPAPATPAAAAAPLALDATQRAAWSAAALYGEFIEPEFDETKADEYRLLTAAGTEFLKHGKSGKPHSRLVFVSSSLVLFFLESAAKRSKPDLKQSINLALATIPKINVVKGKTTPNFQRNPASARADENLCFSIVGARERNLDLEAKSQAERDAWFAAIKFLLHEAQLARERALVYGAMGP